MRRPNPYVYHEKFYRQREMQSPPRRKTHAEQIGEGVQFHLHTHHLSGKRATDVQDDSQYEETDFLGPSIYPNPEYDKQLRS